MVKTDTPAVLLTEVSQYNWKVIIDLSPGNPAVQYPQCSVFLEPLVKGWESWIQQTLYNNIMDSFKQKTWKT